MVEEVSVGDCVSASPVQVVPRHVVVLDGSEHLDLLADEAGRQQAVGPQLETLLQGESHALRTHTDQINHPPQSGHIQRQQEWEKTTINCTSSGIYLHGDG